MRVKKVKIQNNADVERILTKVGSDRPAWQIMSPKMFIHTVLIEGINNHGANMIKQEMLAIGADAAVSRSVGRYERGMSTTLLFGTTKHFRRLISKLRIQPYGLQSLAAKLDSLLFNPKPQVLEIGTQKFDLSKKILVMGILNTTPDSFYDGGKYNSFDSAVKHINKLVEEGVDIIDIGGESTRPGAKSVKVKEEISRVIPIIKYVVRRFPKIPVSIDTYKSEVAVAAVDTGAQIINDISGLRFDKKMVKIVAKQKIPVVIMHIQGTPKNMQNKPVYKNVVDDIYGYFEEQVEFAINNSVEKDKIIIDPGFGFGKTVEHNIEILQRLAEFKSLELPLLVGTSRKSFIGKILGSEKKPIPAEERLAGSLATYILAIQNGANILRVHDIAEIKQIINIIQRI